MVRTPRHPAPDTEDGSAPVAHVGAEPSERARFPEKANPGSDGDHQSPSASGGVRASLAVTHVSFTAGGTPGRRWMPIQARPRTATPAKNHDAQVLTRNMN